MLSNNVSGALSDSDRKEIIDALTTIRDKMPFLVRLSAKAKRSMPKMGDKSRAFVQKALEVAERRQDFLPRSFDIEEMHRDAELFDAIFPIAMEISQLQEEVDDTLVAVGSDAYSAALQVYRHAKAHGDGSGLDTMVDELAERFGRRRNRPPMED